MIINADDFCLNERVTKAIRQAFSLNVVDRTTCMVNTGFFNEEMNNEWTKSHMAQIGLHLNLTEGKPLTEQIKECKNFVDESGNFINNLNNRKGMRLFFLKRKEKKALRLEIEAQFKLFRSLNHESNFFDSHHHIHTVFSIFKIIKPIAKKYGFSSTRLSKNVDLGSKSFVNLYKRFFNKYVSRRFSCLEYFGAYNDYMNAHFTKFDNCEMMVHPDLIDGELIDLSSNLNMIKYERFKKHE